MYSVTEFHRGENTVVVHYSYEADEELGTSVLTMERVYIDGIGYAFWDAEKNGFPPDNVAEFELEIYTAVMNAFMDEQLDNSN